MVENLSVFKRLGCQQISVAQSAEGPVRTESQLASKQKRTFVRTQGLSVP